MNNEMRTGVDPDSRIEIKQRRYDHLIKCESNLANTLALCSEQSKSLEGLEIEIARVRDMVRQHESTIESDRASDMRRNKAMGDLQTENAMLQRAIKAHLSDVARAQEEIKVLREQNKTLKEQLVRSTAHHIGIDMARSPGIADAFRYMLNPARRSDTINVSYDNSKVLASEVPVFHKSPTGGQKDIAGKPRLDLVPFEFIEGAANAFEFGTKKYSAHNWRKGIEVSILVRSLLSHVMKYNNGENKDRESGLHHLDHACATLAMLITTAKTMPHMDNRYSVFNCGQAAVGDARVDAGRLYRTQEQQRETEKRIQHELSLHAASNNKSDNPEGRV
jgi:hypothetical protein